jgi:phosphatidylglycerophosphate synthase
VPDHPFDLHEIPSASAPEPHLWPLTWPMGLTMLRLLLLPVFLWLVLDAPHNPARTRAERCAALVIFCLMALTDKLDGYLARKLHHRPSGPAARW